MAIDREFLGRLVRRVWVEWAYQQPNRKDSWLWGWENMSKSEREVDRRIGEKVAEVATAVLVKKLEKAEAKIERLQSAATGKVKRLLAIEEAAWLVQQDVREWKNLRTDDWIAYQHLVAALELSEEKK